MKKTIFFGIGIILAAILIFLYLNRVVVPEEYIELNGEKYKLSFYDDFDGKKLDWRKWSHCPESKRQDVGGKWDDSMISLDGKGNLVVTSDIDDEGTPISGAIRTMGKFKQARGYFEIRCKLQSAPGFWGAFWLMCRGQHSVGNGAYNKESLPDSILVDYVKVYTNDF